MRCFVRTVTTAAVLVLVAASASPAHAQILGGSYLPPYGGGYPRYPTTGAILGTGGLGFDGSPLYGGFRGGYGGVVGYGGDSYYSSRPYYNSADRALYEGSPAASRGIFGWRRNR